MSRIDGDFLKRTYRLNHMVRYNPWPKLNPENVAAHSFYTSLFALVLCEEFGVSPGIKLEALEIALVHDTPESVTNDITHDAKVMMPELDSLLAKFERQFIDDHFPQQYSSLFMQCSVGSHIARLIVKLADVLSTVQYCNNEISLGNSGMNEILGQARQRVADVKNELEEAGIRCQKIVI